MNPNLDFQILISTMNRENLDFLWQMFPHHDLNNLNIIIVNQTAEGKLLISNVPTVKVLNSFEKGLSKSRNLALQNVTKDWCLLADDDLVYLLGFEKHIASGIQKYSKSGVLIFQAQVNENLLFRKYPDKSQEEMAIFKKLHVRSIEMLLNKRVIRNPIHFHESFGLGSDVFNCGEEQIVMFEISKKEKLNISFFKKTIVQHPWLDTGREYDKKKRYFSSGAFLAKVFPSSYFKWICIQLFFDVKQGNIKIREISSKFNEALRGVKQLKKIENEAN